MLIYSCCKYDFKVIDQFNGPNLSTLTAGLLLQSMVAGALDDDNYVALASLDLSTAFDIVNVAPLLKRLQIMGLPADVVSLKEI